MRWLNLLLSGYWIITALLKVSKESRLVVSCVLLYTVEMNRLRWNSSCVILVRCSGSKSSIQLKPETQILLHVKLQFIICIAVYNWNLKMTQMMKLKFLEFCNLNYNLGWLKTTLYDRAIILGAIYARGVWILYGASSNTTLWIM